MGQRVEYSGEPGNGGRLQLEGGRTLDGLAAFGLGTDAVNSGDLIPWEDAGGAEPSFGALDAGSGATAIDLGSNAVIQSSWGEVGGWCGGHCRIKGGTEDEAGGTGNWTILGLPRVPLSITDGGINGGTKIGSGFLIDGATSEKIPVDVVVDPFFSDEVPVIFPHFIPTTLAVVTDSDPSETKTDLRYAKVPMTNDGSFICHDDNPFDFVDGAILNVSLWYPFG